MDIFLKNAISVLEETEFNKEKILYLIEETENLGGIIYTFGNGGSASAASHFSADLVNKRFKSICLNDSIPVITAIANDYSYDKIFLKQLENFNLSRNDLTIGITCSGYSKNIVEAIKYARKHCPTIVFTAFNGGRFKEDILVDQLVYVPTTNIYIAEGIHSLLLHDLVWSL